MTMTMTSSQPRAVVRAAPDGTWYARVWLGRDAQGRAIRPYRRFSAASSREEAQEMADEWARGLTADGVVRSARLADLLEEYCDAREALGASPNSVRSWRSMARNHVARLLPRALAAEVTPRDLQLLERRLLSPAACGGAGLARSSVLALHNFLRAAFAWMVEVGACQANPMVSVRHPTPGRAEAHVLDEWDLPALDAALARAAADLSDGPAARDACCAMAAWLALRTGVRVGEACALRRRDLSRQARSLHVGGTVIEEPGRAPWRRAVTKGRRSRNVSVTDADVAALAGFLARLDAALGRLGPDAPLLTPDGEWMRPSSVSRSFSRLARRLGLPRGLTFHGLRHTHATWCLANGVDLKTLSERLGHADEATTLRIYAHVLAGRDAAAAEAFARAAAAAGAGLDEMGGKDG